MIDTLYKRLGGKRGRREILKMIIRLSPIRLFNKLVNESLRDNVFVDKNTNILYNTKMCKLERNSIYLFL